MYVDRCPFEIHISIITKVFSTFVKLQKKEDIKQVLIQILLQRELMENMEWKRRVFGWWVYLLLACLALLLNISLLALFLLHNRTETVQKYTTFFASSIIYNTLNRYRVWLSSNIPTQERRKDNQTLNQKVLLSSY